MSFSKNTASFIAFIDCLQYFLAIETDHVRNTPANDIDTSAIQFVQTEICANITNSICTNTTNSKVKAHNSIAKAS